MEVPSTKREGETRRGGDKEKRTKRSTGERPRRGLPLRDPPPDHPRNCPRASFGLATLQAASLFERRAQQGREVFCGVRRTRSRRGRKRRRVEGVEEGRHDFTVKGGW